MWGPFCQALAMINPPSASGGVGLITPGPLNWPVSRWLFPNPGGSHRVPPFFRYSDRCAPGTAIGRLWEPGWMARFLPLGSRARAV